MCSKAVPPGWTARTATGCSTGTTPLTSPRFCVTTLTVSPAPRPIPCQQAPYLSLSSPGDPFGVIGTKSGWQSLTASRKNIPFSQSI